MSWMARRGYGAWDWEERAASAQKAKKKLEKLAKEMGSMEPIGELRHRLKIAASFWGRAWCQHLESLGDYENRLPRGRSYVRNGSVKHLHIEPGLITAVVLGSDLYEQKIHIKTLDPEKWQKLISRCRGRIGSLIELLQGKISEEILAIVTDREEGLFPLPGEIRFDCSCPDYASMCKHIAAVLYGVGARLDEKPELLFTLRGVRQEELLTTATETITAATTRSTGGRRRLAASDLAAVFGEDLQMPEAVGEPGEAEAEPILRVAEEPPAAEAEPVALAPRRRAQSRRRPPQKKGKPARKSRPTKSSSARGPGNQ